MLLAGTLRMGWPAATEFKADEARLYALALDAATGAGLPLRGIGTSVGFPNFPLSVWLYALPLWVWPHPYSAVLFTGALNTLAVAACWWLARRVWGAPAALLAALLVGVLAPVLTPFLAAAVLAGRQAKVSLAQIGWIVACMVLAMEDVGIEESIRTKLLENFFNTADFMRNKEG